jgi:hypothetical protein
MYERLPEQLPATLSFNFLFANYSSVCRSESRKTKLLLALMAGLSVSASGN